MQANTKPGDLKGRERRRRGGNRRRPVEHFHDQYSELERTTRPRGHSTATLPPRAIVPSQQCYGYGGKWLLTLPFVPADNQPKAES